MRKEPVMSKVRFVGLDVHAATIAVAVAEPGGEVRALGTILNEPTTIRKLVTKLGAPETLRVCYEAGPTGYTLYWQLAALGVSCEVVAPTLVPTKAGDRVKTDRRDAEKLARSYRAGDLTPVWVPDAAQEALRDLVRAREVAKQDQLRAQHRVSKLLLRRGQRPPQGLRAWTHRYLDWVQHTVRFAEPALDAVRVDYVQEVLHARARVARLEEAVAVAVAAAPPRMRAVITALQALRGVALLTATTIVSEVGALSRFTGARQLMGYAGLGVAEASSGARTRRGGITKTGNAHLRRVVVEAMLPYRHPPAIGTALRRRQREVAEPLSALAWKAQHRLCARYRRLRARGKPEPQVRTAIARELLGFVWAIGIAAERAFDATLPVQA